SRRYGIDGYDELQRTNEVYLTGLDDRNFFDLRFYKFNVQEPTRDYDAVTGVCLRQRNARQPWARPSFDYSFTPDGSVAGGELNIDVNVQGISRDLVDEASYTVDGDPQTAIRGIGGNSARFTAEAEWKRSFITGGGLMLTPILHARTD